MKKPLLILSALLFAFTAVYAAEPKDLKEAQAFDTNPHQRIVEISHDNFQDLMHFSRPVVIEVYSQNCVYCKRLDPILAELNNEMGADYQFAKLSYDRQPDLVDQFNVRAFPTVLFIKDGKEAGRHVGYFDKARFKAEIENYLGKK